MFNEEKLCLNNEKKKKKTKWYNFLQCFYIKNTNIKIL